MYVKCCVYNSNGLCKKASFYGLIERFSSRVDVIPSACIVMHQQEHQLLLFALNFIVRWVA